MKNLQKYGGFAAFYLALAYITGIIIFLIILDYPSITDMDQKLAMLLEKTTIFFITNLIMYVVFGFVLIILTIALYERINRNNTLIIKLSAITGIIWACLLIGSGLIANAGIAPALKLIEQNHDQAVLYWSVIETVANGLASAEGEIVGGLFTLLISLGALRNNGLPKFLNYLGLLVGTVGIVSTIPGLKDLTAVFGITQVGWFVWLGVTLLSSDEIG